MEPTAPRPFAHRSARFGPFQIDFFSCELFKSGIKVHIQNHSFQILTVLLERPGEVVSREDLGDRLWQSHTFVDFDQGLNTAVMRLRHALEDSAGSPRFIETLPRHGYRFIAPVSFSDEPIDTRMSSSDPPQMAQDPLRHPSDNDRLSMESPQGSPWVWGRWAGIHISRHFSVRVIQADYLRTRVSNAWFHDARLSAGIVLKF